MSTIFDLLLLTITICFIVDISGFFTFVKKFIASRMEGKYKNITPNDIKIPFVTCSTCGVWWGGLVYLLLTGNFTIPYIATVAILSMLSSNISGLLLTVKDFFASFEMWLQKIISK